MVSQVSTSDSDEHEVFTQVLKTDLRDPPSDVESTEEQQKIPSVTPTKKNSNKASVSVQSTFTFEELTPDDEIFTMQCPETFNKQDLCKQNVDFTLTKPTITIENEVYQFEFINTEKKSVSLAVPKKTGGNTLVNLPLKGHVVIKKVVDVPAVESEVEDVHADDKHAIVFPSNIKVRHPLLGVDWKEHIDLVNTVINKKKLFGKKHKKDKSLEMKEDKKLKRESGESDIVVHKKKKKRES